MKIQMDDPKDLNGNAESILEEKNLNHTTDDFKLNEDLDENASG